MSWENYRNIIPNGPDFREKHPQEAFTWGEGLPVIAIGYYAVVFKAIVNKSAQQAQIATINVLDRASTIEAEALDEFCVYVPDGELSKKQLVRVSTCLWTSQRAAKSAMRLPAHARAMRYVVSEEGSDVYDSFSVEGFEVSRYFEDPRFRLVHQLAVGEPMTLPSEMPLAA